MIIFVLLMWVTLKQMDDLGHHLKNASREDILRLLESGLNPFLTRKNLKGEINSPFFYFSNIYFSNEITEYTKKNYFRG